MEMNISHHITLQSYNRMETRKFKTNAKCGGCVAKIEASLNTAVARNQWDIDLSTPNRVLTITSDLSDDDIVRLVVAAGFKAEKIG